MHCWKGAASEANSGLEDSSVGSRTLQSVTYSGLGSVRRELESPGVRDVDA